MEKVLKDNGDYKLPYCLDGERAGPPEDCGGMLGYDQFLKIFADPSHDKFKEVSKWLSEIYNNDQFNKNEINKRLACIAINDVEPHYD